MTIGCKQTLMDCISKYRTELAQSKDLMKKIVKGDNDIKVSDHFYIGNKICSESLLKEGGECHGTKYPSGNEKTYSYYQTSIEKSHSKDLTKTLSDAFEGKSFSPICKTISECKTLLKEQIPKILGDYGNLVKNSATTIRSKLGIDLNQEIKEDIDINSLLKGLLKEKSQPETDDTRASYDIIKSFYQDGNINSTLRCSDSFCFNTAIDDALLELNNNKDSVLQNTQSILQHIQVTNDVQDVYYGQSSYDHQAVSVI